MAKTYICMYYFYVFERQEESETLHLAGSVRQLGLARAKPRAQSFRTPTWVKPPHAGASPVALQVCCLAWRLEFEAELRLNP